MAHLNEVFGLGANFVLRQMNPFEGGVFHTERAVQATV